MSDKKYLFQLKVDSDEQILNWVPLEQYIYTGDMGVNCGANTLCFTNLKTREESQELSIKSEINDDELGMTCSFIGEVIQEYVRDNININEEDIYDHPIQDKINVEKFKLFFNTYLEPNSITILNLKRINYMGHTVTIAKTNNSQLVIFDPQQQLYFSEEQIDIYLQNSDFSFFSVYSETNELKRKMSDIYPTLHRIMSNDIESIKSKKIREDDNINEIINRNNRFEDHRKLQQSKKMRKDINLKLKKERLKHLMKKSKKKKSNANPLSLNMDIPEFVNMEIGGKKRKTKGKKQKTQRRKQKKDKTKKLKK